jgi:tRNA threonylcarbamoyladenosine biosynthesis protein TsaB
MDARRDEIYYSIFEFNNNKLPKRIVETDSLVLNSNSFHQFLKSSTVNFIGNSNEKIMNFIDHKNAIFSEFSLPSAKEMGILSHLKFIKKDFVDISEFQPKYLKEFGGKKIKN